jgi:hypothetical protein
MKLDLLTNATVVEDAIRFVSCNTFKQEINSSSSSTNRDDKEEVGEITIIKFYKLVSTNGSHV